jgi:alpha-1,3-rhamnosyl/mannosyltransferase
MSTGIEERIRESPAASRIRRLGYVSDDDVPALYNGAEALVLPSLYEGFGMGILEAMASGCPVVVSDISSMPEVAGSAGVLVDPFDVDSIRDGIVRATSPQHRRRLIESGLKRAASFTWEATAAETMDVILRARDGH